MSTFSESLVRLRDDSTSAHDGMTVVYVDDLLALLEQFDANERQLGEFKRDAERYKLVRIALGRPNSIQYAMLSGHMINVARGAQHLEGDQIDACVDAAILELSR